MKHWRTALILLLVALILTSSGCSKKEGGEDQIPNGAMEPLSYSALIDSDGLFKVVGEVQNTGSKSLTQVAVKVTFYGASGVVLDEETSLLTAWILKPDQKWPFSVAARPGLPVADVDHYVVEIDDSSVEETDEQPYGDLVILSENSTASGGTYTVQGQVRNNGSQVAKLVRVVATFYDATGTVVADREQFVLGATATQLTPGEVASFSITVGETLGTYIAPRGAGDESQDTVLESLATQQVSGQPAGGEPADTAPGGDIASYETQADSSTTSSPTSGSGTCCSRSIGALDPKMPPGQLSPMGGWLSDAMDGTHVADPANRHCPRDLWILDMDWREQLHLIVNDMGYAAGAPYDPAAEAAFANFNDLDYLIMGQLTLDQQTDYVARVCEPPPWEGHCVGGDIIGRWTFKMELVDHHRGQVVVDDSVSWSGSIFRGLDTVKEMSRNLPSRYKAEYTSLSQVIQDYEGLPEAATLQPEKDPALSGEKMTVHLTDIKDYQGRLSQPWQWVVVKAESRAMVLMPSRLGTAAPLI